MFISKLQPPLAAILKTLHRNILKNKKPFGVVAVFQILLDKSHLYFCVPFPLTVFGVGLMGGGGGGH